MKFYKKSILLFLISIALYTASGQTIPLINSREVIKEGVVLYDSNRFEESIKLFKTIPEQDTNYVYMLSELALSYNGAKQYDSAIAACKYGLKQQSAYKAQFYKLLGTAYDSKGDFENSVNTYKEGIKNYPFDYSLHYNLGITYYNHKTYDKAEAYLIKTLNLNPFHASSHLNLGRLSAFQGKKVRAMMSLGIYMSLAEKDNPRLVFLENLMNNALEDEGTFDFSGAYPFERLDQIIRAKIVNDKNFKAVVPVNAMLAKQYQLLLDQLKLIENQPDDFWIKFYLPFYQELHVKNLLEPFLYHILTSTTFEAVPKWKKKNEKKMEAFYTLANARLKANRVHVIVPEEWGFKNPVSAWYNDDNQLTGIGSKDAKGNEVGKWRYYSANGELRAQGEFDAVGKKIETWKYYLSNSTIKSTEHEKKESTEIEFFNEYGEPTSHYMLKDGSLDGEVEVFFTCGKISERYMCKAGKKDGPGKGYYTNGNVEVEYVFKDDMFDGPYTSYNVDGKIQAKYQYKLGKLEGDYAYHHPNGKIRSRGAYKDDKIEGRWKYYYANGQLEKEGDYRAGELFGEWMLYDLRGHLTERKSYDDKGEIQGEDILYRGDEKYAVFTYEHGKVVGITYYDKQGNVLGKSGDSTGTFAVKGYFPDGPLLFEGAYKNGKENGEWKYYYHEGMLRTNYAQVDGEIDGDYKSFFRTGQIKVEQKFDRGNYHGYSREYYIQGQLKEEGWYQNDKREQVWISYYADGAKESENYYVNGLSFGQRIDYNVDGKIYSTIHYRDNKVKAIAYFNEDGTVRLGKETLGENESLVQKFENGNPNYRVDIECGNFDGVYRWWPNGNKYLANSIENGRKHGPFEYFTMDGKPDLKGQYLEGDETGKWTWYYDNGKVSSEGIYIQGERDSTWTYYSDDEKITSHINYLNGERNEISTYFAPNGMKKLEELYEGGNLISYRTAVKGELGDWMNYTGKEKIESFYQDGQKAYEESHNDGLLHGDQISYYPNGQVMAKYKFDRGDYSGDFSIYYPNGKLKKKGSYKLDELDGAIFYYSENGTLTKTVEDKMGVVQGKTTLYKNGDKNLELKYWAGFIVD